MHSGVQMGIQRWPESGVLNLIPNAGVRSHRACVPPNVFRTSFSNSQPTWRSAEAMVDRATRRQSGSLEVRCRGRGFEGFKATQSWWNHHQGLGLPFPNVEFQALLTEIASLKPDAVACFLCGAAPPSSSGTTRPPGPGQDPLYGSGFLTEACSGRRRPGRRRHHRPPALQRLAGHAAQQGFPSGLREPSGCSPDVYTGAGL